MRHIYDLNKRRIAILMLGSNRSLIAVDYF